MHPVCRDEHRSLLHSSILKNDLDTARFALEAFQLVLVPHVDSLRQPISQETAVGSKNCIWLAWLRRVGVEQRLASAIVSKGQINPARSPNSSVRRNRLLEITDADTVAQLLEQGIIGPVTNGDAKALAPVKLGLFEHYNWNALIRKETGRRKA